MNNSKKKNGNTGSIPVYSKRVGAVRVSVFENQHEERTYHNVVICRRYKDGDEWKDTNTFNGLGDLAALKEALLHVGNWLSQAEDCVADES